MPVPCHYPWNALLLCLLSRSLPCRQLSLQTGTGFKEVNKQLQMIHPLVMDPYILVSLLPSEMKIYMLLDLKNAFFCLSLALISHHLFAFE